MSYNHPFGNRNFGCPPLNDFTPFSAFAARELMGNNFPYNLIHQPPSYLIQQQNNFFNHGFPLFGQVRPNLLASKGINQIAHRDQYFSTRAQANLTTTSKTLIPRKNEKQVQIIDLISDEQIQPEKQAISQKKTAVVAELKPKFEQKLSRQEEKKVEVQKKTEPLLQDDEETKRITRYTKRISKRKQETEKQIASKKKKIKEKLVYNLSLEEKTLMDLSRLREIRQQIMVGPHFQAKIPVSRLFSNNLTDWQLQKFFCLDSRKLR